jgi:drug/metabolite transporter (DMT)-like permease
MIRNPRRRRPVAILLIVLGALLMFFAPDNAWIGIVLGLLGIAIEAIGLAMAERAKRGD